METLQEYNVISKNSEEKCRNNLRKTTHRVAPEMT